MFLEKKIFNINSEDGFNAVALEIFRHQYEQNNIYRKYASLFCKDSKTINNYLDIPFLPLDFFKTEKIICGGALPQQIFKSSGTTGSGESAHYVCDLSLYEKSAVRSFEMFYGQLKEFAVLALLPGYLERKESSLVWMTNLFISKSNFKDDCGFFLDDITSLIERLRKLIRVPERKILLLGVSYALLDVADEINFPLKNVVVMETGGMKGKRKEIIREELHGILCGKLGVSEIHSEYGMTEMLSQAYSLGKGIFKCPPWMKIIVREMNDPLSMATYGKTGGINIIDLANINSCAFIATQDLGKIYDDGTFEVLGRFDNSNVRGCNLMIDN